MKLPIEQAKEFNKVNFPVVKAAVETLIIKGNKILLTKRNVNPEKDKWCIPGGHIDIGETPEEAIIREIKEETDLIIKPQFLTYYNAYLPSLKVHALVLLFVCNPKGEIKINEESSEFGWFTKEEALKLNLAFNNKDIIIKYFQEKK